MLSKELQKELETVLSMDESGLLRYQKENYDTYLIIFDELLWKLHRQSAEANASGDTKKMEETEEKIKLITSAVMQARERQDIIPDIAAEEEMLQKELEKVLKMSEREIWDYRESSTITFLKIFDELMERLREQTRGADMKTVNEIEDKLTALIMPMTRQFREIEIANAAAEAKKKELGNVKSFMEKQEDL